MRPLIEPGDALDAYRFTISHHREIQRPAGPSGEVAIGLHPRSTLPLDLARCPSLHPLHEVALVSVQDLFGTGSQPCEYLELGVGRRFESSTVDVDLEAELWPDGAEFFASRHADDCRAPADVRVCSRDGKPWIVSMTAG